MSNRLFLIAFLLCANVAAGAEVVRAGRWELHSSFWLNLHDSLMQSVGDRRDLTALTPEERATWIKSVDAYRAAAGQGNITFARPMAILQDDLGQAADDAATITVTGPLADAARESAPVYRKYWWPAADHANRFFIRYAAAMLADAGEELARKHEALYGAKLPKSIRVDVVSWGGPFGAYSRFLIDTGYSTTMSSRDPGYQGFAVLEMVLHEASHAIVDPKNGAVARAITKAAAACGIDPPRDLWHAILFAASAELAREALAARGITTYVPSTNDMFTRVWPKYRQPIETFWDPYVAGRGTLDDSIARTVASIAGRTEPCAP